MVGAPPTLGPYETVLARINSGRAAPHTPENTYIESRWPLADRAGRTVELEWPDYGGEQLHSIRKNRSMSRAWRERIMEADGWIVMVRIAHHQLSDDIFSRPLAEPGKERQPVDAFVISPQAQLVDFLQWLMIVRGSGTLVPLPTPPIELLLSCWDELPDRERSKPPLEVLQTRMPMVAAFVATNWQSDAVRIVGLSSLERTLSEDVVDAEFVDCGPEAFGYVVLPDGRHDEDLTLAIASMV